MVTVTMRATASTVICGTEEAARMLVLLGCAADIAAESGETVTAGDLVVAARGPAAALLPGWQSVQGLIEWGSGVAHATADIVQAVRKVTPDIVVCCPQDAIPGARPLARKAVASGGALVQWPAPSDAVLILAEHRAFGGLEALRHRIEWIRESHPGLRVVVEVATVDEAICVAGFGADMIQLGRVSPAEVAAVTAALGSWGGDLVVAGEICAHTATAYALSGAHVLVTSAPFHAVPAGIEVAFEAG